MGRWPTLRRLSDIMINRLEIRWAAIMLGASIPFAGGCAYYRQAAVGQWEILANLRSNSALINDPGGDSDLSRALQTVDELRVFASDELSLQPGEAYTQYADVKRQHVIWSIFAAPEFSLEPRRWWYPVVGKLSYRGYFSEKLAGREAVKLRERGFDVYVGGVDAYSTLGWFNDPVLSTFIDYDDSALAELIFHELTHKKLYLAGKTEFNEALATAVAQEGVRRWLTDRNDLSALTEYEQILEERRRLHASIQSSREELTALFESPQSDPNDHGRRRKKALILDGLRADLTRVSRRSSIEGGCSRWADAQLNNARLNAFATYYEYVPLFERLLEGAEGDFQAFFDAVVRFWEERSEE